MFATVVLALALAATAAQASPGSPLVARAAKPYALVAGAYNTCPSGSVALRDFTIDSTSNTTYLTCSYSNTSGPYGSCHFDPNVRPERCCRSQLTSQGKYTGQVTYQGSVMTRPERSRSSSAATTLLPSLPNGALALPLTSH